MTNPFLTPDRVPPPSTQALAPGMAAPYYQGDPLPGAQPAAAPQGAMPGIPAYPASAPSSFTPTPAAAPPASYPGAIPSNPGYPANPVTPTPNAPGYGAYSPQANGDAVGVPQDSQSLRFAAASLTPTSNHSEASAAVSPAGNSAEFRTPIQSMLPLAGASSASRATPPFTPNAGAQAPTSPAGQVVQATFETPLAATTGSGKSPTAAANSVASADGFRPQGSQPATAASNDSPADSRFRPPSIGKQTAGGDSPTGRFGVGPQQEWLRGQLEYWPETGEWSINYMDEGPKDQIGGRVLIDNPQVLANLPAGEFVMVEGQLYGRQVDENFYRPAYRISSVQRQRQ
jgi:hypothetical protein